MREYNLWSLMNCNLEVSDTGGPAGSWVRWLSLNDVKELDFNQSDDYITDIHIISVHDPNSRQNSDYLTYRGFKNYYHSFELKKKLHLYL